LCHVSALFIIWLSQVLRVGEWVSCLLSAIYSLCTAVVVRAAVTGPDSSWVLICQHTKVPYHR